MVKTGDYVLRPAYNGQTITHVIYIRANCLRRLGKSIFLSCRHQVFPTQPVSKTPVVC